MAPFSSDVVATLRQEILNNLARLTDIDLETRSGFTKPSSGNRRTAAVVPLGWSQIRARPVAYLTIPLVAAFVGWFTNWVSVQMLFYPIKYAGIDIYRQKHVPYGFIGWQGVVPTKADVMAARLTDIVTAKLLSLPEAGRTLCILYVAIT